MGDWVKRIIQIGIAILILSVIVNDVARYLMSMNNLDTSTRLIAQFAKDAAQKGNDRNAAGQMAAGYAETRDVRLWAYNQDESHVYVYTEADVPGTWVLETIMVKVLKRSWVLRDETSTPIR